MQRRNFLSGGLAVLCANFYTTWLDAQEREAEQEPSPSLIKKIREAQTLLASESPRYPRRARIAKAEPRRVLLAVMDTASCAMETVPIRYFRKAVDAGSEYVITTERPGWTITALSGTGMACIYRVEQPKNKVVLANRFPFFTPNGVEEIVYTAPSPGVHTPEMVEEGLAYLDGVLDAAFAELYDARINWKCIEKGKPLISADSPRLGKNFLRALIKTIVAIEHIDHAEFYDDDPAYVVEKVLVTLGANREQAFNWSGSSAGAFGLAQFMRSTYAAVRSAYPEAQLVADFTQGMRDHVNAVKAMACLIDRELHTLLEQPLVRQYVAREASREEKETAKEHGFTTVYALQLWLLACAAYNGGPGKIPHIISTRTEQWYKAKGEPDTFRIASLRVQESFLRSKLRRKKLRPKERRHAHAALARVQKKLRGLQRTTLPAETRVYLEKALAAHLYFAT